MGLLLRLASKAGLFTAYQPIPDLGLRIADHRERGVFERWAAIRNEFPETPISLLDVGCNVGFYVTESAKLGHFAVGLDTPEYTTALSIIKNALGLQNVMPVAMKLDLLNARSLPSFDVIIILQVFHHLCAAYGSDDANDILRTLWRKTKHKLIFEVEASGRAKEPFRSKMPMMGDDSDPWVRDFFEKLGCAEVRVIYRDEGHDRSVFAIEKKLDTPSFKDESSQSFAINESG